LALLLQLSPSPAATPDAPPWTERAHKQTAPSPARSSFEIDRDRIIHCGTFRELQYKTQVKGLLGPRAPRIPRTRLNHVLEVAQISRGLARSVGANDALAEAIALAHDLGHPPFGHAGERALRAELRSRGFEGWNANVHSLVVVDLIEATFMEFRGLDLTWATREGIARHSTPFDEPVSFGEFAATPNGGLECQIVDVADVFAYLSHDLDDAVASDYLSLDEVRGADALLEDLVTSAEERWAMNRGAVWPEEVGPDLIREWVRSLLIHRLLADTTQSTLVRLEELAWNAEQVRAAAERVVRPSKTASATISSLLDLLTSRYYRSSDIAATDAAAAGLIAELFDSLVRRPDLIPERFATSDPVTDAATYLASLNDFSAAELAERLMIGRET
jgi:dGTPase